MPFKGEPPGRLSQGEIASNPDFQNFLKGCTPLEGPDDTSVKALLDLFQPYTLTDDLPSNLLAIDGGEYVSAVSKNFPSREILHVRIGSILLDLSALLKIGETSVRTVNPFEIQRTLQDKTALTLFFTGANVLREGAGTPRQGFRLCLNEQVRSENTRLDDRLLIDSIYDGLAARIAAGDMSEDLDASTGNVLIKKCANEGCGKQLEGGVAIPRETFAVDCPHCANPMYATDTLRLHEAFSDHQGNDGLVSRTRNLFEHLLLLHYLIYLRDQSAYAPQHFGFVMDGALAIFGEGARFHRALMRLVADVDDKTTAAGLSGPVLFGVQKSGAVHEFAKSLDRSVPDGLTGSLTPHELAEHRGGCIPKGTVLPISDTLRFKYITPKSPSAQNEHGYDTYYGQDMIVKTHKGHLFVINLAYPFGSKTDEVYKKSRFELRAYPGLRRALGVLEAVQSGLYGDSTVPQMLANQYASISRTPGGKILDILAKENIN